MFSISTVTSLTPFYSYGPAISVARNSDQASTQPVGAARSLNDPTNINGTAFDRLPGVSDRTALDDLQSQYQTAQSTETLLGLDSDARTLGRLVDVRA